MTTKPLNAEIVRLPVDEPPSKEAVIACLYETISSLERGELEANKVVVITLDSEEKYDITHNSAGLRHSEIISTMEALKLLLAREMNLI